MQPSALIETLAAKIAGLARPHPARIAVDGVDGVGKSTLANNLAEALRQRRPQVIRASIDGFHNPRSARYRLGPTSPEGYFRDSFNYSALVELLLDPLGSGGSLKYCTAIFDYRNDSEVARQFHNASPNAILLFDGVFLLRPELARHWDLSVFLDAPFEVTVPRMAHRDQTSPSLDAPANVRYIEGQKLYLRACEPIRRATIVVNNEDLESPTIVRSS